MPLNVRGLPLVDESKISAGQTDDTCNTRLSCGLRVKLDVGDRMRSDGELVAGKGAKWFCRAWILFDVMSPIRTGLL
jgi:hypothetical protein